MRQTKYMIASFTPGDDTGYLEITVTVWALRGSAQPKLLAKVPMYHVPSTCSAITAWTTVSRERDTFVALMHKAGIFQATMAALVPFLLEATA